MVQLLDVIPTSVGTGSDVFNSNMVQLLVPGAVVSLLSGIFFQFQYGAIISLQPEFRHPVLIFFNSNMVQLLEDKRKRDREQVFHFQFQYGAIISHTVRVFLLYVVIFNSNIVQLLAATNGKKYG